MEFMLKAEMELFVAYVAGLTREGLTFKITRSRDGITALVELTGGY